MTVARVSRESAQFILWEMPLAQGRQYQQIYWMERGIALTYVAREGGGELADIVG